MSYADCPCSGGTLDRFLRPTVMAVLARHPAGLHGYVIAQHLEKIDSFRDSPPDSAGLYRTLRAMEAEGYLCSDWETEGTGPARRVFSLTREGRECLRVWSATLELYARNLKQTIRFIQDSLQAP
jgi:DNA-binding PadR family transcriptional regulator